jgi:predicted amidohydrolase YtcJ
MRRDPATQDEPWYPGERIEPWQAIDCYTIGAAEAAGGNGPELVKAGARPDFTILDRNILASSSADAIPGVRATAVVIGGEPHFSP